MPKLVVEERIRYPPFESYRFKPELLPIATKTEIIAEDIAASDVDEYLLKRNPPFTVGSEDSWIVEKRYLFDGKKIDIEMGYNTKISQPITSD